MVAKVHDPKKCRKTAKMENCALSQWNRWVAIDIHLDQGRMEHRVVVCCLERAILCVVRRSNREIKRRFVLRKSARKEERTFVVQNHDMKVERRMLGHQKKRKMESSPSGGGDELIVVDGLV
jgi:hypothetical protein